MAAEPTQEASPPPCFSLSPRRENANGISSPTRYNRDARSVKISQPSDYRFLKSVRCAGFAGAGRWPARAKPPQKNSSTETDWFSPVCVSPFNSLLGGAEHTSIGRLGWLRAPSLLLACLSRRRSIQKDAAGTTSQATIIRRPGKRGAITLLSTLKRPLSS